MIHYFSTSKFSTNANKQEIANTELCNLSLLHNKLCIVNFLQKKTGEYRIYQKPS